ncbi:MAG: GNAT family N-acetyltransferase [Asgard group archaeon]|nr:GNAT family N-acetyltransferase [Asgard group archaeon]
MDFKIRPAEINDINEIYEIEKQCFDKSMQFEKNLFYFFLLGRNGEVFLVAETSEDESKPIIAGFIVAYLNPESNFEIITLNVLENYRRQKIGTKLMLEIEQFLQLSFKPAVNLTEFIIELMVYEKNFPALKLYEKLGYIQHEKIQNYYQNSKTGIKMIKKITLKC